MLNPFKVIKYQLYLLQLENYELGRFWQLLIRRGWFPKKNQRKELVWTAKAVSLGFLAELIIVGVSWVVATWMYLNAVENVTATVIFFWVFFFALNLVGAIFLVLAYLILWPVDFAVKQILVARAKAKIESLSTPSPRPSPARGEGGIVVIGIAGSYGKTTMKEVLAQVLSEKYKVESTPDSVNTPVGIARWILKKVNSETEIIIVEMGEHYKGDVEFLCKMLQPDIGVITGINESHLERMGSMEAVAATVLELDKNLKSDGLLVVNADDEYLFNHQADFKTRMISYYGSKHLELTGFVLENIKFDAEKLVWHVEIPAAQIVADVPLLGEYAVGLVVAAQQVVGALEVKENIVGEAMSKLKPVEHRLQPIKSAGGVLVIDDAYNGNPAGVAEAIKVLGRFTNRRKIFITPGLVETGKSAADIHRAIGKQLVGVADVVVLIKNSVTPYIAEELTSLSADQLIWFNTAQEAHTSLGKILKPGDVVLFQNDWGDQYL